MSTTKFTRGSTIYVSVPSNLSLEQTQTVTKDILRIAGHPTCFSGFKFQFVDESDLVSAHIGVDKQLNVSALV